ncbi:MAG TPA: DoxX family membrane protein [Chthoniobacterales bacterium]|nr:DoxX family membrane protein [Chthoniobacterales bacterium]
MKRSRVSLALFFVAAGIGHLVWPNMYLAIIPSWVPSPAAMITMSGVAEICGGIGVLPRLTRRWAGWGLIGLLVAVFPANVHALSEGMSIAGHPVPTWLLWARLPLQLPLLFWVYSACLPRKNSAPGTRPQRNAYGSERSDGVNR